MKDHVEIGHLAKYGAFRVNRDQVMDLLNFGKANSISVKGERLTL